MPKRKSVAKTASGKKRKIANTAVDPDLSSSTVTASDNPDEVTVPVTAAARFMGISELRQYFLRFLDKPTLARMGRVEKALTYDVAQVLYEEVDFGRVRSKMSRVSVCAFSSVSGRMT